MYDRGSTVYISTPICEIVFSGVSVYVLPRFRASVPKLFGLQANLAQSGHISVLSQRRLEHKPRNEASRKQAG